MKIHQYSLMREVVASQLRPRQPESLWKTSPLVVMNNFAGQEQLKLAMVLFQNLFPSINVQTTKLSICQAGLPSRYLLCISVRLMTQCLSTRSKQLMIVSPVQAQKHRLDCIHSHIAIPTVKLPKEAQIYYSFTSFTIMTTCSLPRTSRWFTSHMCLLILIASSQNTSLLFLPSVEDGM